MCKARQLIPNKWTTAVRRKGQFILVNRWAFKLDIECCWWAEVYQCPCPAGYELIPCWYSWRCEQSGAQHLPLFTTGPSPFRKQSHYYIRTKVSEVEQSPHSLRRAHSNSAARRFLRPPSIYLSWNNQISPFNLWERGKKQMKQNDLFHAYDG